MLSIFGNIDNPLKPLVGPAVIDPNYIGPSGTGAGLIILANNLLKLVIVVAGIYAFINIIAAGYGMLASQEPKEIGKAWAKLYQSMIGLLIIAGSFVLAAIFGWMIFGNATILLTPQLFGP